MTLDLGTGKSAAGCRRCNLVFTCDSAFDKHLRMRDGESIHLAPAAVGLELKPNGRWGGKSDPANAARMARFTEGRSAEAANSPGLG